MKNLVEFLEKNHIEYEYVNYGNPYYYNDGFRVQAISITFDYDLADDIKELEKKKKMLYRIYRKVWLMYTMVLCT